MRKATEVVRLLRAHAKGTQDSEAARLEREAAVVIEQLSAALEGARAATRVETPFGALLVKPSGYGPDCPGIWVDFRPSMPEDSLASDADDLPLVLIEYTTDEGDSPEGEGRVVTRVWGDVNADEYTYSIVHTGFGEEDDV